MFIQFWYSHKNKKTSANYKGGIFPVFLFQPFNQTCGARNRINDRPYYDCNYDDHQPGNGFHMVNIGPVFGCTIIVIIPGLFSGFASAVFCIEVILFALRHIMVYMASNLWWRYMSFLRETVTRVPGQKEAKDRFSFGGTEQIDTIQLKEWGHLKYLPQYQMLSRH